MDQKTFKNLRQGDIIRHKLGTQAYILSESFRDRVIPIYTADLIDPEDWVLLVKAPIVVEISRAAVEYIVHETGLEPGTAEELLQSALDLCLIKAP